MQIVFLYFKHFYDFHRHCRWHNNVLLCKYDPVEAGITRSTWPLCNRAERLHVNELCCHGVLCCLVFWLTPMSLPSFPSFFPPSFHRRLEQNGIRSVPPGAFSPYKKLRRMWVYWPNSFANNENYEQEGNNLACYINLLPPKIFLFQHLPITITGK